MKSQRRHELATNELADWITHLPQWIKQNQTTVIAGAVIVIGLIGYTIFFYSLQGKSGEQKNFQATGALEAVGYQKQVVLQGAEQGYSTSDIFVNTSNALKTIAAETDNRQLAALAMVKRAEALRAELHYRSKPAEKDIRRHQIAQAKEIYEQALEKAKDAPAIAAAAEYGIAICLESMGDFDAAKDMYKKIAANADYQGTSFTARADFRQKVMDDFNGEFIFAKAPRPQETEKSQPDMSLDTPIDIGEISTEQSLDLNLPQ